MPSSDETRATPHAPDPAGTVARPGEQHQPDPAGTIVRPEAQPVRLAETVAAVGAADVPGFEIEGTLGRGGMGVVYKATQTGLGRTVALKMLIAGPYADPGLRARFLLEAESVAALEHPHIVRVFAFGESRGHPYLAMEFVSGGSLADRLKALGPLPAREAAELVVGLAEAVAHAHSRGVVHRDIKPANVLLTAGGELRLADFGLAKVGRSDLSVTGQVLGTPAYMAPEQAAGKIHEVGTAADVYALGAVLYDLLTGRPPFQGDSALVTLQKVLTLEPSRPRALRPDIPRDLETICLKCLEKSPDKRYATADVLTADLRAFLDWRPITARPVGASERAWKWAKRNPGRAGAIAAAVLIVFGGAVVADEVRTQRQQDRRAADRRLADEQLAAEEQRLAKERVVRADDLVGALATADTAGVPRLIDDMKMYHDLTGPKLRAMAAQPVDTKPGLHARLALVGTEPDRAAELAAYVPACRADELLALRPVLKPYAAAVSPALWAVATGDKVEAGPRVRAACALAGLSPSDPRWADVAPRVAELVARENPLQAVVWAQALEPVRNSLLGPLVEQYRSARDRIRNGQLDESALVAEASAFDLTATLLARYASDRPAELAELAIIADPRHYARFSPALTANKTGVVPVLKAEMTKPLVPDWKDAPLRAEWVAVDAATVRAVRDAQGLLHERFGFAQAAPLAGFEVLANTLGRSGYRPVRVRPYVADRRVLVAAVWARDGMAWKLQIGLIADAVRAKVEEFRKDGFQPSDVAAWVDPDAPPQPADPFVAALGGAASSSVPPPLRFVTVWHPAPGGEPVNGLVLAVPYSRLKADLLLFKDANRVPLAVHAVTVPEEDRPRYSAVWGTAPTAWEVGLARTQASYQDGSPGKPAADVALFRDEDKHPQYASVWNGARAVDVEQPTGLSIPEQLLKARELAGAGWRPVALGVADTKLTAAVWHRPAVTDAMLEEAGRRRGYAGAALVALGEGESAWPAFRFPADGDPTARSHLPVRLAGIGADPKTLMQRFDGEADVSAKRALLVTLGDFPLDTVPGAEREAMAKRLLVLYRAHTDPGLHGAIDWLLRQKWGKGKDLAAIDAELAEATRAWTAARGLSAPVLVGGASLPLGALVPVPADGVGKDWYVNGEGQTFAVVRGPVAFALGSPPSEPGRMGDFEPPHSKRIPRTFAVATKEVTVEQFLRFRPKHDWVKRYSPGSDTPAVSMTWYEAAEYCNWLSAREGIPREQWCYEPNRAGEFGEGMRMKTDHLKLTGYRLPSEAEWEFACRGGAGTSRYYGRGEELLPRYAWFLKNAEERAWPVGTLRPNELGLFDTLGNAIEWVEDPWQRYSTNQKDDVENGRLLQIEDRIPRTLRGGSFFYLPVSLRSAFHVQGRPGDRVYLIGFRTARTLPGGD